MKIVIAAALLVSAAACSGDTGAPPPRIATSTVPTPTTGVPGPGGAPPAARPTGGPGYALIALPSPYGSIVETGSGFVVYAFSSDGPSRSACTGACTSEWPPLIVTPGARFGEGIDVGLVGQVDRGGGSHQLSYGGHPLYTYRGDGQPGRIGGQAVRAYGGVWLVVSASGSVAGGSIYSPPPSSPGGA